MYNAIIDIKMRKEVPVFLIYSLMLVGKIRSSMYNEHWEYHQYPFSRTEAFVPQLLGVLPPEGSPGYLPQESALN